MNLYKKTYLFAVIFGSMVIGSCSSYIVPLKGNYSDIPAKITSIETVDSIWLHINQLFSEKGLVIKKSDREKGIIVSAKSRFSSAYTFEDNKGQLIEPEAWIVLKEVFVNKKK